MREEARRHACKLVRELAQGLVQEPAEEQADGQAGAKDDAKTRRLVPQFEVSVRVVVRVQAQVWCATPWPPSAVATFPSKLVCQSYLQTRRGNADGSTHSCHISERGHHRQ